MNAEQLLAHYERVAEAPHAVERLRQLIFNLAVRGKLVQQDPTDEPARILVERIGREIQSEKGPRKGLLHEGGSTSSHNLPEGWALSSLRELSQKLHYGYTASADHSSKSVRLVRITDIQNNRVDWDSVPSCQIDDETTRSYALRAGDLLIARTGGTIGKTFLVSDVPYVAVFASYLIRVQPASAFWPQYLKLFCESDLYWEQLREGARGGGQPNVNGQTLGRMTLPIPPVAEQHRIAAKVDELMALCDRLEAARAQREATRERLTAATLARLNTPEPTASPDGDAPKASSFQSDARFALNVLPALTARTDQIEQFRQTILDLAVRGHLEVGQASDGGAAQLLEAIVRCTGRQAEAATSSPPFDLPPSWCWSSIGGLAIKTGSGSTPRGGKEVYKPSGVMFLRSQNIYDDGLRLKDVVYIDPETHSRMRGTAVADKDLLLNITGGSIGRCALVQDPDISANVSQHVAIIRAAVSEMAPFVHLVVRSPYFQRFVNDEQTGAGRGGLPKNRMDPILVPVPPLAEQHRIVAKVDELMFLCDQLEASLSRGESTRSRLLNALLHEALQSRHDNVIDLAEARKRMQAQREAVACRIVERLAPRRGFGRVRAVKALYLAEAHCAARLGGTWGRGPFGPFDQWIYSLESHAASQGWFSVTEQVTAQGGTKTEYKPGAQLQARASAAAEALGTGAAEFERILALLADLNTDESEMVATLYAAWNDLLLEGRPVSDEVVIREFREHWGVARKSEFAPPLLQKWLDWMRNKRLVPKRQGPSTRHQRELI